MRTAVSILGAGALGLAGLLSHGEDQPSRLALPEIQINDNRRPAGQVREGVLYLRLEVRMGTWRPEGLEAPGVEVTAFGVENGTLQNPGPVIRVPEGTEVQVSLRNLVPGKTLHVYASRIFHLALADRTGEDYRSAADDQSVSRPRWL